MISGRGGCVAFAVSPDGQNVVGVGGDQKGYLYPTAGATPSSLTSLDQATFP